MLVLMHAGFGDLMSIFAGIGHTQFVAARGSAKRQDNDAQYDSQKSHCNKSNTIWASITIYYNNMVANFTGRCALPPAKPRTGK